MPIFRERVWGRRDLPPYLRKSPVNEPIGEVWFTFSENLTSSGKKLQDVLKEDSSLLGEGALPEHPDTCPLLVKLLFTSERLSVQVHPNDTYAREHHGCLGKTEAWYVMETRDPGEVAVGLKAPMTPERFESAVESGEVEELLDWRKVHPGEVVFVPAGTVHAIGAGCTICEIQENSDITYRLYDYGRPRELHLQHGLQVSVLDRHTHEAERTQISGSRESLLQCDYFHIERLRPQQEITVTTQPFYRLLICLSGEGQFGGEAFSPGRAWFVPAGNDPIKLEGNGSEWIYTYTAPKPIGHLEPDSI